jgi:signal transduction histidine kinase
MADVVSDDGVVLHSSLGSRWKRGIRLGWYALALLMGGIFIASIPGYIKFIPIGISWNQRFAYNPSPTVLTINILSGILAVAATMLSFYLAFVIFRRRPENRMAVFLSYYLLIIAVLASSPIQILLISSPQIDTPLLRAIIFLITLPLSSFFFLIFPDGRFAPNLTRWLGLASFPVVLVILLTFPAVGANLSSSTSQIIPYIGYISLFVYLCLLVYAQFYRYRHYYSNQQQTQVRWVVYAMGLSLPLWAIASIVNSWTDTIPSGAPMPFWASIASLITMFIYFFFPLSLTMAVMRHQLYDVDHILNRTLVYGGLSAVIAGLYALSVGVAGLAVQQRSSWIGLLITAVIVAITFRPLQRRVQRGVDQLLGPMPGAGPEWMKDDEETRTDVEAERDRSPASRWFRLARTGWVILFGVAFVILILAIPGFLARRPLGDLGDHLIYDPTTFTLVLHRLNMVGLFLAVLISYGLGLLLFKKRKNDGMALFTGYYLVLHGLLFGGTVEMLEPMWPDATAVNSFLLLPLITLPLNISLLAIFPDGRFVPRWTRWLIPLTLILALMIASQGLSLPERLSEPGDNQLVMIIIVGLGGLILAMILAQIHRYRHVSTELQRQQAKWVLYGFMVMVSLFAVGTGPWGYAQSLPAGSLMPWWISLVGTSWAIAVAFLPITLVISVLRYRLYDVDILINRTLVFVALSAFIVGVYILIVGGLGTLFQSSGNLILSLVATGLVAVLFNPLRQRLQRAVNRMIYGDRDEPFTVLRRLGKRLEGSGVPEEILAGIVETVATALKLPYAEISLRLGKDFEQVACYGRDSEELVSFAIHYQGQTIGNLNVALRGPGESLADADHKLLRHIARHAAPVAHSVQLTRDLRRSRTSAVTARERERRRLRRDLHDGLGPVLASQGLKIAAVGHLLGCWVKY